ncbi:MAG TPA: ABC transporter permease [Candidatus Acidoferrum sp.]|nr:ABC transporter permease [Candidatus Acidoferrum sp.]
MKSNRKFVWLVGLLAALHIAILLAGFVAPYDEASQNREAPFAPPTRLHFVDTSGHFHVLPFVYVWTQSPDNATAYVEDRSKIYPLHFLAQGSSYELAGLFHVRTHLFGVDEPAEIFLLGTDQFGRDVFSRTMWGGQISLLAGLLATGLTLGLGTIFGILAGFYGGWWDAILMRGAELFLALPWLYLLFAVRAFLPLQVEPKQAFLLLVTIIGLVGWARPARIIRGIVLSARERDFVRAARGFGASDLHILRRHVLPQAGGAILTQAVLLVPQYVLAEITLSFLGLGIGEPQPTWGNMLTSLMQIQVLESYWWMIAPGIAAVLFFLCYLALGNALEKRARLVAS